ncbi:MAG: ATP-dependent phosphofructokinase / diphosphate-dependent phosphofructokinase [Actinomycetota bacterium]|jgi:6-phosphofructokinase 1|nr:ATP-dependent phosphofructokinase / diphosphate-dependent phosphofructokinase [Actinomycetota bacterium]
MKIGVLTAGGDCPGLNAVIGAVTRSAMEADDEVIGIRRGYAGLANRDYMELDRNSVSGLLRSGGTILGTSSFEPHREQAVEKIMDSIAEAGMDAVIAIGGEHTMGMTGRLHAEEGAPVIGVPKTIDNDISGTDYTFGFDTAVQTATDAIDRLQSTAQSHDRVMVVEVMGRNAGWIAVHSAIAGGADAVVIPEFATTVEELAEGVAIRHQNGKNFSIIVVAEGASLVFEGGSEQLVQPVEAADPYGYPRLGGIGAVLARELEARTGFEVRVAVLGHIQRGGTPTATDRLLATRFGVRALDMAKASEFGRMVAWRGNELTSVPLEEAAAVKSVDEATLELARRCFAAR